VSINVLNALLSGRPVKLPSLPVVALKILNTVKSDEFTVEELARTISSDPALAARTLSAANSSLYSPPSKVDTIERAVSVLGSDALKNIALSFVIINGFKDTEAAGFDYENFWRRSVTSAVAAQVLSARLKKRAGDAFVAALLMDIGQMVMFTCRPGEYRRVQTEQMTTGADMASIEKTVFGYDHQDVGRELMLKWGIPESIHVPAAFHHDASACPAPYAGQCRLLMAADMASAVYNERNSVDASVALKRVLGEFYSFSAKDADAYIDEVGQKTIESLSLFDIDPGEMKPYSRILEEANAELISLNMSYEQLVLKLRQSNETNKKLAEELRRANQQLRTLVFRDPLTGLYNHRFFYNMINKEVKRSERYGEVFSLIILDVDNFKAINDTHGHIVGDMALKGASQAILGIIRDSDTAARYAGDEFAILLPNTGANDARGLAERLKKAIEDFTLKTEDRDIKFTVSVGVGSHRPGKDKIRGAAQIIDSVDRALYESKRAGKNRVHVASI
jgi:diguanylate cyclase (GGDEF)-like protein